MNHLHGILQNPIKETEETNTPSSIDVVMFTTSYLATAAWVTCDSDENTDFTKEAIKRAQADCGKFIKDVIAELGIVEAMRVLTIQGSDVTYIAAHDFFLTRNGHGAGFWDKELLYSPHANKLTEIATKQGGVDIGHLRGAKSKLTFD